MSNDPTIPRHCLLLHTPWEVDKKTNNYVGTISQANLTPCNLQNEHQGATPEVTDCFLVPARDLVMFDAPPVDDPAAHEHSIEHGHAITVTATTSGTTGTDDNDWSNPVYEPGSSHDHRFVLQKTLGSVSNRRFVPDLDQEYFVRTEPRHQEINAYYAEDAAMAPVGTIAFTVDREDLGQVAGWKRLSHDPLDKAPSDQDPNYRPAPWHDVFVKVVGCVPRKNPQGEDTHTHPGAQHSHPADGSVAEAASGGVAIDDSSGTTRIAGTHSHWIESIARCLYDTVQAGSSVPRHWVVSIWVKTDERAGWGDGMIVPYVPRQWDDLIDDLFDTPWKLMFGGDPSVPIYLRGHRDTHRQGSEAGDEEHTHPFPHEHLVETKKSAQGNTKDSGDVHVAQRTHTHKTRVFDEGYHTGPAPNALRHRPVTFIYFDLFNKREAVVPSKP